MSALHPSLAAQDSWQTLTDNRDENPTIEADWDKPHQWKCEKAPKFCSTPGVSIRMADKTALDAADSACVDAILARRRATRDAAACPIILRNANRYLGNNIFKRWWPVRVGGKLKRTGGRFEYVTNKAGKENSNRCISYSSREKRWVSDCAPSHPLLLDIAVVSVHFYLSIILVLTRLPSFVGGCCHTEELASSSCQPHSPPCSRRCLLFITISHHTYAHTHTHLPSPLGGMLSTKMLACGAHEATCPPPPARWPDGNTTTPTQPGGLVIWSSRKFPMWRIRSLMRNHVVPTREHMHVYHV